MKPHAKNAETATATTAPPVVFLAVRVDVLPPKVTLDHVREYLAAFIEDRHPILMEHQLDAMGEVKAVVVDEAETYTLTPEESARLALRAAQTARLEALADKEEDEMVGRWPLFKTPEAPPLYGLTQEQQRAIIEAEHMLRCAGARGGPTIWLRNAFPELFKARG